MFAAITPPAILKPSGSLYLTGDMENLTDGIPVLVTLNTIPTGFTDGIEDTANKRITPGKAGLYSIRGQVTFYNTIIDKIYGAFLRLSGSTYIRYSYSHASKAAADGYLSVNVNTNRWLNNTDYVQLHARPMSGVNTVDVIAGELYTFLEVQFIRP